MFNYACFISTGIMLAHMFTPSYAEITFDGSVGKAGALSGPNYLIDADRGALQGNNLFHSFGQFNINTGESATFSGPESVVNIIGRVTGGSFSSIDGALNSTIPNADLYLLNPNGFMFGPNARLNIEGSFHLSTADYLRFADGQRFETGTSAPPLLSIAPPEAFGFFDNSLDNSFGNIIINGSQLNIPIGKDFSLVGGDIGIQSQDATNPGALIMPKGYLQIASAASAGEVMQSNVMNNTLTQFGDIVIQNELINSSEQLGKAVIIRGGRFFMSNAAIQNLAGNTEIVVDDSFQLTSSLIQSLTTQDNAGDIDLRGKQIDISQGSQILNLTLGRGQAGDVNLTATESISVTNNSLINSSTAEVGKGGNLALIAPQIQVENSVLSTSTSSSGVSGDVVIKTDQLALINGGRIGVETQGIGRGGAVNVQAVNSISITGNSSGIVSQTRAEGDAGTLELVTPLLILADSGVIGANTSGTGQGGKIILKINDLQINQGAISSSSSGAGSSGEVQVEASQLHIDGGQILAVASDKGDAGHIQLEAERLVLANGAQLNASSLGAGQGGNITVNVAGIADIFGQTVVVPEGGVANPSGISSSAFGEGQGGTIRLSAQALNLDKRGTVQTLTQGEGKAGDIILNLKDLRMTEGGDIDASNEGTGIEKGGQVTINATGAVLITAESSELSDSGFFGGIYSSAENAGAGGNISLSAGQLTLREGGTISAKSTGSGNAGNLTLQVNGALNIENEGQINTSTKNAGGGNIVVSVPQLLYLQNGQITTSVHTGKGRGGDITMTNPVLFVLNQGKIKAQADEGHGGDIHIKSEQFLASIESLVSASSRLGIDGNVEIDAPDNNVVEGLLPLPTIEKLNVLVQKACDAKIGQDLSSLVVVPTEGTSNNLNDLLPSGPLLLKIKPINIMQSAKGKIMTTKQPFLIAFNIGCSPNLSTVAHSSMRDKSASSGSRVIPEKQLF